MYQKIMVAVDGSRSSQRAVEEAARIAKLTHGHVRSVYVLDWAPVFPYTCYYDLAKLEGPSPAMDMRRSKRQRARSKNREWRRITRLSRPRA